MILRTVKQWGWIWWGFILAAFGLGLVFGWNAWQYRPEWGYDAKEHINYIFSLAEPGRLPTPGENYLAWHEPGYYWVQSLVVRGLKQIGLANSSILKAIQLENALLAWLMAAGSGLLGWLLLRSRVAAIGVMISTGCLFIVAALGRYITNETWLQTFIIWWLVLFFYWRLTDYQEWRVWRWLVLVAGLAIMIWIKLTAIILAGAVVVWLGARAIYSYCNQENVIAHQALGWAGLIVVVVMGLYAPWFLYKQKMYGRAFTINNYEMARGSVTSTMPLYFYFNWDESILRMPFWTAGNESFWTMLVASAVVDYDNVFQTYPVPLREPSIQTGNGRFVTFSVWRLSQIVLWVTIPLLMWLVVGVTVAVVSIVKKRASTPASVVGIVAFSLLLALMYNVYRYPFLERGTLKAIFIAAAFPLLMLLAIMGWKEIGAWASRKVILRKYWSYGKNIGLVYWLVWCALALRLIILPG